MSRLSRYEEYLWSYMDSCLKNGETVPDWLWEAKALLFFVYHLDAGLKGKAIAKASMERFAQFDGALRHAEEYPPELKAYVKEVSPLIRGLYAALTEGPDRAFTRGTDGVLTKEGRRIAREYRKKLLRIPLPDLPGEGR